jgi:hypothetical protein
MVIRSIVIDPVARWTSQRQVCGSMPAGSGGHSEKSNADGEVATGAADKPAADIAKASTAALFT